MYLIKSNAVYIPNGSFKSCRTCCVYGSRLELVGKLRIDRRCSCNGFYHLAACKERRHFIQQLFFAVKHAYSHRGIKLVTRECKEICSQLPYVNGDMGSALCAVHQHDSSLAVSDLSHLTNGIFSAQHV